MIFALQQPKQEVCLMAGEGKMDVEIIYCVP